MPALLDGLTSLAAGLGMIGSDKAVSATYVHTALRPDEVQAAYRSSWLCRAAVDMPANDAFSKGREWQAEKEKITALEAEDARLDWHDTVLRARKAARLYGGSAIWIDDGASDLSQPLDPATVRRGGLRRLVLLARGEVTPDMARVRLLSDPLYGQPVSYRVGTEIVHPSRLAIYTGEDSLEIGAVGAATVWGDSVLDGRLQALKDAEYASRSAAVLIGEASIDVLGIPGLMQGLAGDPQFEARVQSRVASARAIKGSNRMLVMDKDEDYQRKGAEFGALPQLLQEAYQIASGATGIPATRLLGRAPAGMSATGAGDEQVYFGLLGRERAAVDASGAVLDRAIVASALGGSRPEVHHLWPALGEISAKARAEMGGQIADKWSKIALTGLMDDAVVSEALANDLIENGVAPGLEASMEAARGREGLTFGEGEDDAA